MSESRETSTRSKSEEPWDEVGHFDILNVTKKPKILIELR